MFGIGQPELLIIIFILLLLFGPTSLPKLSKTLGESIRSLKDGATGGNNDKSFKDIAAEVTSSAQEIRSSLNEIKSAVSMDIINEATKEPKSSISEVNHASSVHKNLMSQLKDA